ncbi:MAG: RidA family protein [Candidatus Levybacteria bacterium]|nr:RidA family protein [Candidatus Levybacteria bacterium]
MNSKEPKPIGPYSQTRRVGKLVFCSGQIGVDPETSELVEGVETQTKQTLKNLEAVLASQGLALEHVVKTTVYLKNIEDFPKMNDMYATFFTANKPARATIGVADLPKGALIEIEAIASK